MYKTRLERCRILVSRMIAVLIGCLCLFFYNGWDTAGRSGVVVATVLSAVGWALAAVGGFGRVWCMVYIAGYKNVRLVQDGPYSVSRNPLYFFSAVGAIGVALTSETVTLPLLFALFLLVYYPPVVRDETRRLRGIYGADYEAYCARVPAFWPKWGQLHESTAYTVDARLIREHICGAMFFVLAPLAFSLCETAHELRFLPTFFTLF